MKDEFAAAVALQGHDPALIAILDDVCAATGMGFAAIARVTEDRWIACQVLDKIEFGLNPGDELDIKTTICNEIRQSFKGVVIDHVGADPDWRSHPTPTIYGFKSYVSLPIILSDGSFYGTLCAIDPKPRTLSTPETMAAMEDYAYKVARVLSHTKSFVAILGQDAVPGADLHQTS